MRASAGGRLVTDADAKRVRFPVTDPDDRAHRGGYRETECLGNKRPDRGANGRIFARARLPPHDRG
ncbi:MAG: hypothetical protein M3T56_04390 [Chloroflexota bacterium]|nr:hypothetical protein [Chloroflexota bacterium]